MPGSLASPYYEDMWQFIVEVGWAGLGDVGILSWWSEGTGYIPMSGRISNTGFASRWDAFWNGMAGPFIPSFSASVPGHGLVQNSGYPVDPEIAVTSDNWTYFEVDVSGNLTAQETLPVTGAPSDPESWDALYLCYVAGAMTPTDTAAHRQNLLVNFKRMREDVNPSDPIDFTVTLQVAGIPYGTPSPTYWQFKNYKDLDASPGFFELLANKEVKFTNGLEVGSQTGLVNQQIATTLTVSNDMRQAISGT